MTALCETVRPDILRAAQEAGLVVGAGDVFLPISYRSQVCVWAAISRCFPLGLHPISHRR